MLQLDLKGRQRRRSLAPLRSTLWEVDLAAALLSRRLVNRASLNAALQVQQSQGVPLTAVLESMFSGGARLMTTVLAESLRVRSVDLRETPPDLDAVALVPLSEAVQRLVVPLTRKGSELQVAMAEPTNAVTLEWLRLTTGLRVVPVLAYPQDIRKALQCIASLGKAEEIEFQA